MTPLATAKAMLAVGTEVRVTNHYITREDHPCFGTRFRQVTKITGTSFYIPNADQEERDGRIPWPKASQVAVDGDTIRLYGGGIGQSPADLFLTIELTANRCKETVRQLQGIPRDEPCGDRRCYGEAVCKLHLQLAKSRV